jgi:molecular chaperone GrpE
MTRIPINNDEPVGAESQADELFQPDPEAPAAEASSPGVGDEVAKLKAERDDYYNRLARATADFKNTQKRLQDEFDQRSKFANQSLIKELLPVIDNFERALAVDPEKVDAKNILKGLTLVHDQWLSVLKQSKVEEIAPKPGDVFDPTKHEALMQQDAPPEFAGKGTVVLNLFQKGYGLHGRTLRPAQVVVSKG